MSGAGSPRPLSVLIAGPTGGGKSGLALDLAAGLGGVVINADAMQVYRDLSILTARPGAADEARAPHRLYGVVDAGDAYSAGRWRHDAASCIDDAHERGLAAIVVGGTGLYFESLVGGLSRVPPVPAPVREKWRKMVEEYGLGEVRSELESRDPDMARRIAPTDTQRTVRALEVLEASGRSLGWWQGQAREGAAPGGDTVRIVVAPPRDRLHARIERRTRAMIEAGALVEVRRLVGRGLDPGLPAMKAIGMRELAPVVSGECELDPALRAMSAATRRYARRQLTWARGHMAGWRWVDSADEGLELAGSLTGRR
jgi:tRNA dimethylallyltransferase